MAMSTSEKIARAYGVLVARGDKVTVRSVQREAGVRIGEVAAWMREHATGAAGDVPEAPDLSEAMSAMVQSVWAAAWKRAAEQADEATAVASQQRAKPPRWCAFWQDDGRGHLHGPPHG